MNTKLKLHPRNKHNVNYDFRRLCLVSPSLSRFVTANKMGNPSIDFSNALSVKALNKAILKADYDIDFWDLPTGYLCPAIPGRADYIHYIADLLTATLGSQNINRETIVGLDIGTGASCIYPLIGQREYQWKFIASDIDPVSIRSSQHIVDNNPGLSATIALRLQPNKKHVLRSIITPKERIAFTLCNPPFHRSMAQANQRNARKRRNLGTNNKTASKFNFGGQNAELSCEGGEQGFIRNLINESALFASQVLWFTSLVSDKKNLWPLKKALAKAGAREVKTVGMAQGQKTSRFIAWTFLTPQEQSRWVVLPTAKKTRK